MSELDMSQLPLLVTKESSWECQRENHFDGNKRLTSDLKKKIVDNDSHILSEECPLARGRQFCFREGRISQSYSVGPL